MKARADLEALSLRTENDGVPETLEGLHAEIAQLAGVIEAIGHRNILGRLHSDLVTL